MRNLLRKHPFILLALLLILLLASCGGGGGEGGGGTSSASSSSSSSSSSSGGGVAWNIYKADTLPDAVAAVSLAGGSTSSFTIAGNAGSFTNNGDGTLGLNSTSIASQQTIARLGSVWDASGSYPKSATVLLQVAPGSLYLLNHTLDLDLALADTGVTGSRVKLVIATAGTGVQLEKWDGINTLSANATSSPAVDLSSAHTYQLVVTLSSATQGSTTLYVDGNASPVLAVSGGLRATASPGDNYLGFGDGSIDHPYESTLDWLIWTPGAYTPAQLSGKLPAGIGTSTGY